MSGQYQPLPTNATEAANGATYPPTPSTGASSLSNSLSSSIPFINHGHGQGSLPVHGHHGPPYALKPKTRRLTFGLLMKYFFSTCAALVVLHYLLLGIFPASSYTNKFRSTISGLSSSSYGAAVAEAHAAAAGVLDRLDPSAGQPGTFFRDSFPIRSMLAFWELSEKEVQARGLDTCSGQISRELIEAYKSSELAYCVPPGSQTEKFIPDTTGNNSHTHWKPEDGDVPATYITCMPVHHSPFSQWWPYPAAPCVSTDMRTIPDEQRKFKAVGCELTPSGVQLKQEMGRERFIGADMERVAADDQSAVCKERVERTVVIIGRQDQWNPFHVAEDLITTLVTIFIASYTAPALINTRVQLIFAEGYGMDSNHFTPLWDRMGAWAPRRLSLDPWAEGTCLTNAIHSVGAGASLLSAMGVGKSYSCASTITWAASHYYRHLFGLLPPSLASPVNLLESHHSSGRPRRPINVLWLSRAKLDAYALKHDDWSNWRGVRHIENEPELIDRLRSGLAGLCDGDASTDEFGSAGCIFQDAQDVPEAWSLTSPDTINDEEPLPIRFATLDPTVHALETQIHFVGHTTILLSSHGGALGLSLFLPPGDGTIIELQVDSVKGNYHFEHMAKECGQGYEVLNINKKVDVDQVWESVRRRVWRVAQSG